MDKALHRAETAVKAMGNSGQTTIKARNLAMQAIGSLLGFLIDLQGGN